MQKKVFKTKKRKFILILIIVGFVMFLSLYGMAKLFIRLYGSGIFTERDSDKMIAYLEKKYDINFPENAKEIKAARDGMSWDRSSSFLLKFTAKPLEVEKFIETAVGSSIYNYRPLRNPKYYTHQYVPEWWKKPIQKGKKGRIYVKNNFVENVKTPVESDIEAALDLYIDTSNNKKYLVYLYGSYRDSIDQPP